MTIAENALKAAAEAQLAIDAALRRRLEALREQLTSDMIAQTTKPPMEMMEIPKTWYCSIVDELDSIIAELGGGGEAE
jgi:hypothetical protein